VSLAAV